MDGMSETKIALVTGANKGIGYAIAAGLGALGYRVAIGARDAAGSRPPSRSCAPPGPTRSACRWT